MYTLNLSVLDACYYIPNTPIFKNIQKGLFFLIVGVKGCLPSAKTPASSAAISAPLGGIRITRTHPPSGHRAFSLRPCFIKIRHNNKINE